MQNCLRMSSSSTSGINNSSRGIIDSCYFNSPAMIVSINTQKKVTVELLFLFVTEPAPLLESKCTFIFWEVILKSVPWSCISWCWVFWSKLNQTVIKSKLDNFWFVPLTLITDVTVTPGVQKGLYFGSVTAQIHFLPSWTPDWQKRVYCM